MRVVSSISFSGQTLPVTRPLPVLALAALWLMGKSLSVNVSGSVGSNISVSCEYPETYENNSKFFCHMSGSGGPECVHTAGGETSSEHGRLALQDDPAALLLTARVSALTPADSGLYRCGADISLRPDFTSDIWITVRETQPQTPERIPEERGEPYSRFILMVALMCVCALFFVCVFALFQVLKRRGRNSGSALHQTRATSNPVPVALQRLGLPDTLKGQSEKEGCFRPTGPDYKNTDYMDVSSQTQDQIYIDLDNNTQSRVYQGLTAGSVQESIYHSIDPQNTGQ